MCLCGRRRERAARICIAKRKPRHDGHERLDYSESSWRCLNNNYTKRVLWFSELIE